MLKNKRADASGFILFGILLFFFAVSLLVGAFTTSKLKSAITGSALNDTTIAPTIVTRMDDVTNTSIQNGYVVIFVFLIVGLLLSSFLVRIHPIFIFIYIIFLGVSIFVSAILANIYQELTEVSLINSVASQQTMITWIMSHIALIMLGVGALSLIITFSKIFGQGGYSETRL